MPAQTARTVSREACRFITRCIELQAGERLPRLCFPNTDHPIQSGSGKQAAIETERYRPHAKPVLQAAGAKHCHQLFRRLAWLTAGGLEFLLRDGLRLQRISRPQQT